MMSFATSVCGEKHRHVRSVSLKGFPLIYDGGVQSDEKFLLQFVRWDTIKKDQRRIMEALSES